MHSVWISTINFKNREDTIDCLNSIDKTEKKGFDLNVVVINNDGAEKLNLPNYSSFKLHILESKENLGFSGGQNKGIKYSLKNGADNIIILNNDTIVEKNFINGLLEDSDVAGIVVPKIYFASGFEFHKNRYDKKDLGKILWFAGGLMDWKNVIGHHRGVDEVDKGQFEKVEEIDFASGCCMLIRKDVFEKVGFFDEKYFLYYEDSDFSVRAKKKKFKIVYNPKSIIWHKNANSAGGSGSGLQDYYITRNRLLFGIRYAPLRSKLSLIKESLRLFLSGRPWQKRGVFDFYFGNLYKGSYE